MYSQIETITPQLASEYLTRNRNNRPMKPNAIKDFARDMRNGAWQLTSQGISFFENGDLADGQNRLSAIIRAGCPVQMYVTRDVPDGNSIFDRGTLRSTVDVLRMEGFNSKASTNLGVATVKMLFRLAGRRRITDTIISNFVCENEKNINIVCAAVRNGQNGRICSKSSVTAAALCALHCGVKPEVLETFFKVANSGFQDVGAVGQEAAIVLRNYILNSFSGSDIGRATCFSIATNAIRDFSNKFPRTRAYNTTIRPAYWERTKDDLINKYLSTYTKE